MTKVKYSKIVDRARVLKKGVEKEYKLVITPRWSYYFAKAILTPNKDIERNESISTSKGNAPKPHGDYISNQIKKADYIKCAKQLVTFVEKHGILRNYLDFGNKKIRVRDYTYMFAKILVWYADHNNTFPAYNNINTKVWTKPTEYPETIYDYFRAKLGKFDNTIDGALELIDGNGYAGYSDDYYSNKTSIDRMADYDGINCTDSCHVFYNIVKHLIKLGKYKKVECIHVGCLSGVGHVRLRIQLNDGDWIYRDPASVLDGNGVTSNWCMNGEYWATDPSWFMENLNR